MLTFNEIKTREDTYELNVYPKRELAIVKGKGCILWDSEGTEYLDLTAGVGVVNCGHCHPTIIQALHQQADQLTTCYSIFYNNQRAHYLEKLVNFAPDYIKKAFLCNSGTEATEAAMKCAKAVTGKTELIALMRGFHGKSMGSLSVTWDKKYQELFRPMLPGVSHVAANKIEKLTEAITDQTSAIIMELIQGEGGVRPLDTQYILDVQSICKEKGIILIIDEVQTGFGRTGTFLLSEQYKIEPDIICCAKSIANGFPMGAILCKSNMEMPSKSHTSTFGGNPLACATASAVLDVIANEKICEQVKENSAYFFDQLNTLNLPIIKEIRGIGLMIGIELKEKAGAYVQQLMSEHHILALLAGPNVIRLLPPLVITKAQINQILTALKSVLKHTPQ